MTNVHPLKKIVWAQKEGKAVGIYSACTANAIVIEAAMEAAMDINDYVLIEATANQVNQYGGYTGMTPTDYRDFVYGIADKCGFPKEKIILGGDHLGPITWKDKPEEIAMREAEKLVRLFVAAGFTKIHIDTSMHLGDDKKNEPLDTAVIAKRGAALVKAAEDEYKKLVSDRHSSVEAALGDSYGKKNGETGFSSHGHDILRPVYVVGSEVPIPGGSQEEDETLKVTSASDFDNIVKVFKDAFIDENLQDAWDNVVAFVVQPGVEFGDGSIHEYDRKAAKELCDALKKHPNIVFEGHSTDYQTPEAMRKMVEDGIAILKVGPALTFALREALFALNLIENELFYGCDDVKCSDFINILEDEMIKNPGNWVKHYHGSENRLRLSRKYSYSDRCRYYLPSNRVNDAICRLFGNLQSTDIPLTLLSQYMPVQYTMVRKGLLKKDPYSLAKDRIRNCIDEYLFAIRADMQSVK